MSVRTNGIPLNSVDVVATQLEEDMRRRGLRPGDRYLTAAEAAETFSINSTAAHRAMRSLAEREVLVRRPSRGTFVGPKFRVSSHSRANSIDVVHLVMAMDYHITQDLSSDLLVDEFTKAIPEILVQVHHVAERSARGHASELIKRISKSRREGMVLIRCSQEVQSMMAGSSIPAVVYGQAYPGIELSSVGHDQVSVGRLLAQHALDCGCMRFALLTHRGWRRGDHMMVDSVMSTLAAAGIGLDAVKVRSLSPERDVVAQMVGELLAGNDATDAFLCRGDFYARVVSEVVATSGPSCRRPRCIISGGHGVAGLNQGFKRVVSTMGLREQVELLAELLAEAASSNAREPRAMALPVILCGAFEEKESRSC